MEQIKDKKKPALFQTGTKTVVGGVALVMLIAIGIVLWPSVSSADVVEAPPARIVVPSENLSKKYQEVLEGKAGLVKETGQVTVILEDAPLSQVVDTTHIITSSKEEGEVFVPLSDMNQVTHLVLNNDCVIMLGVPDSLSQKIRLSVLSKTKCFIIQVKQTVVTDNIPGAVEEPLKTAAAF